MPSASSTSATGRSSQKWRCNDVVHRDLLPGEKGQEVLRFCGGRGRLEAGKVGQEANDVLRADLPGTKGTEVERLVALAEALAVFINEKGMMIIEETPSDSPFRGRTKGGKGAMEMNLLRRAQEEVATSDNLCDTHQGIIDYDSQLISPCSVAAAQDVVATVPR